MKWLSLPLLLFVTFLSFPQNTRADTLSFLPSKDGSSGRLTCTVPVAGMGSIKLSKATAKIQGVNLTIIASPEDYTEPCPVLNGYVLRAEADASGTDCTITCLTYLTGGEMLPKFTDDNVEDIVFRREGSVSGKLVGMNEKQIFVSQKNGSTVAVDLADMILVRSPKSYIITINSKLAKPVPPATPFRAQIITVNTHGTAAETEIPLSSIIPKNKSESIFDDAVDLTEPQSGDKDEDEPFVKPMLPLFNQLIPRPMPYQ